MKILLCFLAFLALGHCAGALTERQQDAAFMVGCCFLKTIPRDKSDCTDEFCKALHVDEVTKKLASNKLSGKPSIDVEVTDEEIEKEVEKAPAFAFIQENQSSKLSQRLRALSRNPVWPPKAAGKFTYRWSQTLKTMYDNTDALDSAEALGQIVVGVSFGTAINTYQARTCVRFIHDQRNGRVTFTRGESSLTEGLGATCQKVILSETDPANAGVHEIGHCIGMGHTHVRSDARTGNYLEANDKGCEKWLLDNTCASPQTMGEKLAKESAAYCKNPAKVNKINTMLNINPYDVNRDLLLCQRRFCGSYWLEQYRPGTATLSPLGYEYNSIMHYPFSECIKPGQVAAKLANNLLEPMQHGVTDNDFDIVNRLYGCKSITAKCAASGKTAPLFIHPDWSVNDVKSEVEQATTCATGARITRGVDDANQANVNQNSDIQPKDLVIVAA